MYWLLLSILTNSALLLLLKAFPQFRVNTLHAIVTNYVTAGTMGFAFANTRIPASELLQQDWLWIPAVLGALFISIFLLLAFTAQTMGVSVATVANKMSVVIPVGVALLFYGEKFSWIQVAGMTLTLVAVYLTAFPARKDETKPDRKLWLPVLVFVGSGVIDALINEGKRAVDETLLPFFISLCFLCAFSIGLVVITTRMIVKKERIALRSVVAGVILGIPNYFSIYGMTKALGSDFLPGSALYPLNNMGIVLVSAICALLIFRERLSAPNWVGILLSLGAIAMIAFG